MTTEEKRSALFELCGENKSCADCPLDGKTDCCLFAVIPDNHVEFLYKKAFPDDEEKSGPQEAMEKIQECGIKDSGTRRQFDTGAVRDIQEGKGRCDLLPLGVIAEFMPDKEILFWIDRFMQEDDVQHLWNAFELFQYRAFPMVGMIPNTKQRMANSLLEVAKHFEEGAKKYGEHNWQKGIPTHCYIDSAIRHYLKWLRGDKDEPHDRAFCWNILCCIWTCQNKPELNDYGKDGDNAE